MVRIIVLERASNYEHVRDLIGQIVKATNWQSAISKADLRSNDPEQILLQRHMARRNCFYERKRGKSASFRPPGRRYQATIKKEKLAQAVGACEFDQRIIRSGVDHLFDDEMYPKIFSKSRKVDWYLARYFTERAVDRAKRRDDKQSVWSYAKWMVVNYVWSQIHPTVTPRGRVTEKTRRYVDSLTQGRSNPAVKKCVETMALHTYRAAGKFYNARANGRDESLFFRDQTGLNKEFAKFMRYRATPHQRKMIKKNMKQLADELAIDD